MFADKFYGGPLDGQEQPIDALRESRRYDPESGTVYVRDEALDTAEARAWKVFDGGTSPAGVTHVAVQAPKGESLTLDQVADLVAAARAAGWSGSNPVHGLLTWKGLLRRLEVRPS